MRKVLATLFALLVVSSLSVFAQNPNFHKGDLYVGPRIGLGSIGVSSLGFIGTAEYGVQDNLGVTATLGYAGSSESYVGGYTWTYTYILATVGAQYHFDLLKVKKLDTYVGVNLGYNIASVSVSDSRFPYTGSAGGFLVAFNVGGRYFFSDRLAGVVNLGYGLGIIQIGVDFKL